MGSPDCQFFSSNFIFNYGKTGSKRSSRFLSSQIELWPGQTHIEIIYDIFVQFYLWNSMDKMGNRLKFAPRLHLNKFTSSPYGPIKVLGSPSRNTPYSVLVVLWWTWHIEPRKKRKGLSHWQWNVCFVTLSWFGLCPFSVTAGPNECDRAAISHSIFMAFYAIRQSFYSNKSIVSVHLLQIQSISLWGFIQKWIYSNIYYNIRNIHKYSTYLYVRFTYSIVLVHEMV